MMLAQTPAWQGDECGSPPESVGTWHPCPAEPSATSDIPLWEDKRILKYVEIWCLIKILSSANGHSSRIFAEHRFTYFRIFLEPTFSFAGLWLFTLLLLRGTQTACERQLYTAKGRCKAMLGEFYQERTEFFCFSVPLTNAGGLWVSMETFSFATAFARLSRKIQTLNRVCGCSST